MFAFSKDLGSVGGDSVSALFSIGLAQDNAISFSGKGDSMASVPSLWKSYFPKATDAVSAPGSSSPACGQLVLTSAP